MDWKTISKIDSHVHFLPEERRVCCEVGKTIELDDTNSCRGFEALNGQMTFNASSVLGKISIRLRMILQSMLDIVCKAYYTLYVRLTIQRK